MSPTALRKVLKAAMLACGAIVSDDTLASIILDCSGDVRHALLCLDVALRTGVPRVQPPSLQVQSVLNATFILWGKCLYSLPRGLLGQTSKHRAAQVRG